MLRAMVIWFCSALILLTAASFLLARTETGSAALGYISSGISFLCAAAAGFSLVDGKGNAGLGQSLVLALALLLLLLTIGFLVGDKHLEASGVLSVVTFTVSGVLFGAVILGKCRRGQRKHRKNFSIRQIG